MLCWQNYILFGAYTRISFIFLQNCNTRTALLFYFQYIPLYHQWTLMIHLSFCFWTGTVYHPEILNTRHWRGTYLKSCDMCCQHHVLCRNCTKTHWGWQRTLNPHTGGHRQKVWKNPQPHPPICLWTFAITPPPPFTSCQVILMNYLENQEEYLLRSTLQSCKQLCSFIQLSIKLDFLCAKFSFS